MANERLPVLDRDLAHRIIDSLTERHISEMLSEEDDWKNEETGVQVLKAWYSAIGHRNVDVFADLSESFIETQFYLNLVIGFYGWHPRSLFTPTPDYVKRIEKGLAAEQKQRAGCKLTKDDQSDLAYLRFADLLSNSVMALPQVLISELNGGRVDLLLWWREHKLVIECDGFAFHKDEEKFVSDRQRDRTLVAAGYEVMRFAGKELTHHAPACAIAVIKHVFDDWGFHKAFTAAEELEPDN